jgi:hypothetical protein
MKKAAARTKEKKTPGTVAVEKYRPGANKLADAEPEKLAGTAAHPEADEIPADFIEALDDFEHGRFVSMETALNEVPPDSK